MNESFLALASYASEFTNESTILTSIHKHNKNVIIHVMDKTVVQKHWINLRKEVEQIPFSDLIYIKLDDSGIICNKILDANYDNSKALINLMDENYRNESGYFFVTQSCGIYFLYHDGKLDENVKSMLETTKEMEKALNIKKPLEKLEEILSEFASQCKLDSNIKNYIFNKNQKISSKIKEQELRNCLIDFINKRVIGVAQQEYCTDKENDEESVDIYVGSTERRAVVEVKFAFDKNHYDGASFYNYKERTKCGLEQLDRYLQHLNKDGKIIHYAYLYMYLAINKSIDEVLEEQEKIYNSLNSGFSSAFNSSFKRILVHDLRDCLIDNNKIAIKL